MKKEGLKGFLLQLDEDVYNEYRELCKINGMNMSQRLRNMVEREIKALKKMVEDL